MNRSELAALIAAYPPIPTPTPTPSSPVMFQDHAQNPTASSPNSPRLAFQSRVRNLQKQRSTSHFDLHSQRRRHSQLEHVSTLRVTQKRHQSAQPASLDTPDFWAEEREAWGNRSPKVAEVCKTPTEATVVSPPRSKQQPVLLPPPPRSQTHHIPQPRKQVRARPSLRIFEPLHTITDTDERPKTSRGPQLLEMLEEEKEDDREVKAEPVEEHDSDEESPRPSASTTPTNRTSKFIEGSMNERSFPIASSWPSDVLLADSDKPLPPTPRTKHVTFDSTPIREPLVNNQPADVPTTTTTSTTKRKDRKFLRRSMSNFNLHSISEKMKIFGGSSHDVAATACLEPSVEKKKLHKSDHLGTGIDVLTDRKRKADEAYAAQFGFKKPKFVAAAAANCNSGTGTAPSPNVGGGGGGGGGSHQTQTTTQQQGRNVEHHPSPHSTSGKNKTLLHRSARRSAATNPTTTTTATTTSTPRALRHKKSRRELERENAELRARLSAPQNSHPHHHHHPHQAPGPAKAATVSSAGNGSSRGDLGREEEEEEESVPPVPPIPGRGVLSVLENATSIKRGSGGSFAQRQGIMDGRTEKEKEKTKRMSGSHHVVTGSMGAGVGVGIGIGKKSFEWPEDVF